MNKYLHAELSLSRIYNKIEMTCTWAYIPELIEEIAMIGEYTMYPNMGNVNRLTLLPIIQSINRFIRMPCNGRVATCQAICAKQPMKLNSLTGKFTKRQVCVFLQQENQTWTFN